MSLQVLRRPAVEQKTGLSRSTIYELMGRGEFPKPIPLAGVDSVGWLLSEVEEWIAACVKHRDASNTPPPAPPGKRRRGRPRKVRTELEHSAA